VETRNIKLQKV